MTKYQICHFLKVNEKNEIDQSLFLSQIRYVQNSLKYSVEKNISTGLIVLFLGKFNKSSFFYYLIYSMYKYANLSCLLTQVLTQLWIPLQKL